MGSPFRQNYRVHRGERETEEEPASKTGPILRNEDGHGAPKV